MARDLVIADTDLAIDYLRGRGEGGETIRRLLQERRLRFTAVTAFELRIGRNFTARQGDISRLLIRRTLPLDTREALMAGALFSQLRASGQGIGLLDCLIAGICLRRDLPLATRNVRRFGRVPGLRLCPPENRGD